MRTILFVPCPRFSALRASRTGLKETACVCNRIRLSVRSFPFRTEQIELAAFWMEATFD